MKKIMFLMMNLFIFNSFILLSETAKAPETLRGNCGEGHVETTFWFTLTDTDGDGKWDWISGKKCDGTYENRPLEEHEMSLGRSINGETTEVISGEIESGSSFVIELVDDSNEVIAHLDYDNSSQSYSLVWLPPTPQSNNTKNNSRMDGKLNEKDLNQINRMKNIYLGYDFDFEMYPNPNNKILKIKTKNIKPNIYNMIITKIDGVFQSNENIDLRDKNDLEINISDLTTGIYIISIYIDNKTISKKLIVE